MLEIDFCLLRGESGPVGLSLVAQPETYSEIFCETFPGAFLGGKAVISIEGGEITFRFDHPDVVPFLTPSRRVFSIVVPEEDAKILKDYLEEDKRKGDFLAIYRDGFMTPGFMIVKTGFDMSKATRHRINPKAH